MTLASCSSSSAKKATPSPPPVPPTLVAFTAGSPNCKSAGDTTAHVTLYWRSNYASSAWLASYASLSEAGDPKAAPHARGPLPPSASLSLPFNCANAANPNEYTLGVYGDDGGVQRKSIEVKRNF